MDKKHLAISDVSQAGSLPIPDDFIKSGPYLRKANLGVLALKAWVLLAYEMSVSSKKSVALTCE
jgi:hypothetical protein